MRDATMLDLPDVLRAAGLNVYELHGWQTAGRDYRPINPLGIVAHDDVIREQVSTKARLNLLRNGHSKLPGPLSHVGLGKDGTWNLVATGRCNHAGRGSWQGVEDGNGQMLGVECAWYPGEAYPAVQIDSLARGCAAIAEHFGFGTNMICHHREWAPRRKADMNWPGPLREAVALHILARAGVTAADLNGIPSKHFPDDLGDDMPSFTDVVDEIEFGGGRVQLTFDGGTRFIDGATWPHEGPFSYPGLPEEARQGPIGFYRIKHNNREGFDLVRVDGARYSFPVS